MFNVEQQLNWSARADEIVAEAARQEGVKLPVCIAEALAQAVRVSCLSQPGVFNLVRAYGQSISEVK